MQSIGKTPGSWRARHDRITPELAKTLYASVKELASKDSSPVSVARRLSESYSLSLSPGTIRHWMVGDRRPLGRVWTRNVFKEGPSPALSYIIGANKGDGCTLEKSGVVKLEVTDEDFAQAFNTNMATLFSREKPNKILVRRRPDRLPMYVVKYSSRQLVKLLRRPLSELLELASAYRSEFLRGFFDAEGHVDVRNSSRFSLSVGVENSNKSLLFETNRLLKEQGISSRIYQKRKAGTTKVIRGESFVMRRTSYTVEVSRLADVRKFEEEVGFSIHRKTQKLVDALWVIANRKPNERVATWTNLYSKVRGEWIRRVQPSDS